MNENMTGLDPREVAHQINAFYDSCAEKSDFLINRVIWPLHSTLINVWCSPRAVEFGNNHFPKLYALASKVYFMGKTICRNATVAYNRMADANGYDTIFTDYNTEGYPVFGSYEFDSSSLDTNDIMAYHAESGYGDIYSGNELKEASPGGIVGMNIVQARYARDDFKDQVVKFLDDLNNLPMDIALYDPSGEMKAAFKKLITDFISEMTDELAAVSADMDVALETEENRIELAKEQATQTMNG